MLYVACVAHHWFRVAHYVCVSVCVRLCVRFVVVVVPYYMLLVLLIIGSVLLIMCARLCVCVCAYVSSSLWSRVKCCLCCSSLVPCCSLCVCVCVCASVRTPCHNATTKRNHNTVTRPIRMNNEVARAKESAVSPRQHRPIILVVLVSHKKQTVPQGELLMRRDRHHKCR